MPASWSGREVASWSKTGRPVPGAAVPFLFSADALDAFQRNIVANVQNMAEEAAIAGLREATIKARQEVIMRETNRGGVAPLCQMVIDGVANAPLTAIKPNSLIVLLWSYLPEVALKTFEALRQRSPRVTGRYIAGLLPFVDGEPSDLRAITLDTKEVRIVSSVPYARRLEVGKTKSGRAWVQQVAPFIAAQDAEHAEIDA